MEEFDCKKCLHEKVCALWASRESQNASCFCTDGCDYFTPTLTPPNKPLTLEELREMDGEPVYMTFPSDTGNQCGHWALVGTQRWGAVSLIYGCGWSSYESAVETLGAKFYRRPPEGEEHCYG